jgi:hypothetical protein
VGSSSAARAATRPASRPRSSLAGWQARFTGLKRDLEQWLRFYDFERAHTGRLTRGRIPAEIVYGARKWGEMSRERRHISGCPG